MAKFEGIEANLVEAARKYLEAFPYAKEVIVKFSDDGTARITPAGRGLKVAPPTD